jgi:heptaprenyl diphosphate synthase
MPITSSIYQQDLLSVKELVKKYTYHPIIRRHLEINPFSSMRQHMVFLMLRQASVSTQAAINYVVTISLVEIGMDLHDQVSLNETTDGETLRLRQLKVLAGDFFSSQYYRLLAHAEESDLIGVLSEAICKVNLYKLTEGIHRDDHTLSVDLLKQLTIERRAALFDALVARYAKEEQGLWNTLYRSMLWLEWLQDELETLDWKEDALDGLSNRFLLEKSLLDEKMYLLQGGQETKLKRKAMIYKYHLHTWLRVEMEKALLQVNECVQNINSNNVKHEIEILTYPFSRYLEEQTQLAEEL